MFPIENLNEMSTNEQIGKEKGTTQSQSQNETPNIESQIEKTKFYELTMEEKKKTRRIIPERRARNHHRNNAENCRESMAGKMAAEHTKNMFELSNCSQMESFPTTFCSTSFPPTTSNTEATQQQR